MLDAVQIILISVVVGVVGLLIIYRIIRFIREQRKRSLSIHKAAFAISGNLVQEHGATQKITDNYRLTKILLGRGSSAEVFVGENVSNNHRYAIKVIDLSRKDIIWRYEREKNFLKDIEHSNAVRLFEVYNSPKQMFFVMELCTGGHLGHLLKRQENAYKNLPELRARSFIVQIARAIRHCHEHGICHRDIKLQNILLENNSPDAQIKIVDFGNAVRFFGCTPLRKVVGTTYTAAPEVFRQSYDERCDVWSLGVVAYILLCGKRPFGRVETEKHPPATSNSGPPVNAPNPNPIPQSNATSILIESILSGKYHFHHGFTISNYLHGGIPTCLFELSTMQSLHLSGLGVDGNLPDNIVLSGNLSDLSLSHNVLTGTIPLIFQEKSWISLDLSYNKLTGTLSSMFNSSLNEKQSFRVEYKGILRLLSLQVNRLSGTIPSSLLTLQNISVLTGNLFECNLMNTNLPKSDSGADTYSCGSNSVDYVLYSWLVVIVVVPLLAVLVVRYFLGKEATVNEEEKGKKEETAESHQWTPGICNGMIETVRSSYFQILTWRTFLREHENHSLRRLSMYHQEIRSVTFYMMLYCMLLLLPIYCILKVNYSSYTNEYAWTISAMLLSGLNPGIVLFFLLLIFVIMTVLLIKTLVYRVRELCVNDRSGQKMPSNTTIRESLLNSSRQLSKAFFEDSVRQHSQASLSSSIESGNPQKSMISSVSESRLVIAIVYFSVFIINIIAMSIVDFSYVYIVITYDATIVSITAFLLALFRISTNNILLSKALPWMTMFYSNLKYLNISQASIELLRNNQYSSKDISFLEILILFNNILIPILAIMFILPDCFYNALFSPDSIQTSYTIETCNGYETGDLGVTNPLYFCSPILQEVSYVPPFIYSYQCSSKIIINYVPVYIVMFIFVGCITPFFHLLCRIWYINMIQPKERREEKLSFYEAVIMKWMIPKNLVELEVLRNHRSLVTPDNTISSSKDTADHIPIQFKLFSKLKLTVNMNSYLAIILSFGTLFPPLAFIGYIAICIISVYEESNIARVLIESIRCGNDSYVEMIGKEFYYIEESINLTLWSTLFVCCGLYAYIIFDTTGDTVGWLASLPLALVMFLLPFILWLVKKIVKRWYRSQDEQEESKSDNEGCEAPSALEDNSPEDGFDVLRSISDIQMIARPSQLIRNNTVENPMIKESSKDPSNQI